MAVGVRGAQYFRHGNIQYRTSVHRSSPSPYTASSRPVIKTIHTAQHRTRQLTEQRRRGQLLYNERKQKTELPNVGGGALFAVFATFGRRRRRGPRRSSRCRRRRRRRLQRRRRRRHDPSTSFQPIDNQ